MMSGIVGDSQISLYNLCIYVYMIRYSQQFRIPVPNEFFSEGFFQATNQAGVEDHQICSTPQIRESLTGQGWNL